jgi:hypothetical protein
LLPSLDDGTGQHPWHPLPKAPSHIWKNVPDAPSRSQASLKNIFAMHKKLKLLLLVLVSDNDALFEGLDQAVDSVQNDGCIILLGQEYSRLKCYMADTQQNALVIGGVTSKLYSLEKFVQDFKCRQGGFQLKCVGTMKVDTCWPWKTAATCSKDAGNPIPA